MGCLAPLPALVEHSGHAEGDAATFSALSFVSRCH